MIGRGKMDNVPKWQMADCKLQIEKSEIRNKVQEELE